MSKISIMIADDHPALLTGTSSLLCSEDNFNIIGSAKNGQDLIDQVKLTPPDIAIVDLEMPIMNGFKAIEILTKEFPKVKTIVYSSHYDAPIARELILKGARGYLPKNVDFEIMVSVINEVYNEGYCFDANISKLILDTSFRKHLNKLEIKQIGLTERELEVLELVCAENTNPRIAKLLEITVDTVNYHRKNIYKKTATSTIAGMVKYAIKAGIA